MTFPVYTVALYADDPRWQAVTASGGTIVLTASGQSGTVTSAGNVRTQPVIAVSPGTVKASGNYNYKRPVLTYNSLSVGLPSYPVDITAAGWNTTGLVAGGTVQADGDDVRVVVNGAEVERWFGYRDNRNQTAHEYGEAFAEHTLSLLPAFLDDVARLAEALEQKLGKSAHA